MKIKDNYSFALKLALEKARELEKIGKRSKWYMASGPERAQSTEVYRQATVMAEFVFGENDAHTAKLCKEFAQHLEQRHAERGRPEYSRWNKCSNIIDDTLSADARFYYEKALQIFESCVFIDKVEIAECLIGLAHLQKEDATLKPETERAIDFLSRALKIYEFYIGVDHPDTAFIYSKIGFAYKEMSFIVIFGKIS